MEQYVTRIGDVTIQRVIPSGSGPPEPVRVMESEELLRAVKEEPIDEDDEEDQEEENEDETRAEDDGMEEGEKEEEEKIIIKQEPQDEDEEGDETDNQVQNDKIMETDERVEEPGEEEESGENEEENDDKGENSKRKVDSESEDAESAAKKKKVEIDVDTEKKKISNLRRNIREVMDETQLDEATLAAQRQEAERLRRVQDQQKYIREVQRQIQQNKQNSKTQSRVISLLQGGSTSILKSTSSSGTTTSASTGPSTVLVKLGSGQQQALNRKTLEVLRGGKSVSSTNEPVRSGITRVTPGNKPAMVTPSVSIAPVKPVSSDSQKKVSNDADVVTISSSSDSEDDCIVISEGEGEEEEEEEDVDPTNSGMHTNDLYNIPDEQGRVLINVGKPESEPEIFLAPQIARVIKPHQIGGVRFLFDNVVESIERFNNSTGFGCILAHSMGLGKTLQVVSFCDVFLRETSARTVMCIMPINTLQNWMAEFNMWLPTDPTTSPLAVHGEVRPRHFGIYVLNDLHKTISSRAKVVEEWNREGGVLLIGYEMYRQLSLKRPGRVRKGKKKPPDEDVEDEKNKPLLEAMHEALVRPGPDLVICDEGHRIKNSHASISHALKQIRTKRRVVLTGYPLQNNLLEYWCMVDFVRPNYLGTKSEFSNMFERPIQNGQCIDSTPQDIRLMRYRAHVLHSLLEGFVQRRSHSVLRNTLPQKEEYVLLVRMTAFQRKLYDTFMNEVVRTKAVPNPLKAFAVCCKIWNHPDILYNFLKKKEMDELQDLDLEETAALHQQTGPNSPRRPLGKEKKGKKEVKKAQVAPIKPEVAAPPQSQPPTPDLKQDERKFDFPNSQQPPQSGPPGYDYYPPPPYSDMSYQYHRPPGMYYQGYYQDNPGYYHGYDQNYPGYYGNFGSMDTYSNPQKNEEFNKHSPNTWNAPYGNIKQEKNPSKSPKDFESNQPKPGYQEFYPVKEEKPDIKEEKQTFLCGFSGGQVSYNYKNYSGYPNYPPYPPQEYPGWNKGGFQSFPQGEQQLPGAPPSMSSGQECIPGGQQGIYSGPNQSENQHRMNTNEDNRGANQQHSGVSGQGNQLNSLERTHSNQSATNDSRSGSMPKDTQQRTHSSQERHLSNQNIHESMQTNQMNFHNSQNNTQKVEDQQRVQNQEHMSSQQQSLYGNQRNDINPDNHQRNQEHAMKRSLQENDPKHLHNINSSQNMQQQSKQSLFNPHDNSSRNQQNMYGSQNSQDDYRTACSGPDCMTPGQQTPFSSQRLESAQGQANKNSQQSSIQSLGENQLGMHGNTEQNTIHSQNMFTNQRSDHGPQGSMEHNMSSAQNVQFHNQQERMPPNHQNVFGNQDNQHFHENPNRMHGSQEQFSSNQQTLSGNKRMDYNTLMSQDISMNQPAMVENKQVNDNQRRHSMGQENLHSGPQQGMFGNQRGELGQEHGQINQQNMAPTQDKQELHHRMHVSERHSNNQQMFINQRNEQHTPHDSYIGNQNKHENDIHLGNQSAKSSNQQNIFSNQRSNDIGKHGQQEHLQANQQSIGILQESPQRIQGSHERLNSSHNFYGNQDQLMQGQQGMFKGSGTQDSQHGAQTSQQSFFGNQLMDHGMHSGQDHAQNPQTNLNQAMQHNPKRMSGSSDHISVLPQNMYQDQNEHSVQKMIKNDSHAENQQIMHSNQDRNPNQYGVFSSPENSYNNQDSSPRSKQNLVENKHVQETQHGPHVNRERLLGTQGVHSSQDQKQLTQQNMFNNQNMPDTRWMHNNQEHPLNQQNVFDHGQHNRDDNTHINQDKQQQFQTNQDFMAHNQQNLYSPQNSQSSMHRSSDPNMLGKQQHLVGNQSIHENQYRMNPGQGGIESQRGTLNNQDSMQGSSQGIMNRQNTQEHNIAHHQDHLQNTQNQSSSPGQGLHGRDQHVQRNLHGGHKSQEPMPGQHGIIGNISGGKHGMHSNTDHSQSNQHIQNHSNLHMNPQSGGHYSQDVSQNATSMQSYGVQNSPQQKLPNHDSHHNNHHPMQTSGPHNNQNMNRNQHGIANNQEISHSNQQTGNNHPHSGNQHNMYGNQYHMQSEQHAMSAQAHHSQHSGKSLPMQASQPNHGVSGSMYSNQMSMQGNSQNSGNSQGMPAHLQGLNTNQGMHMNPQNINTGQGMHSSVNPGVHGSQHSVHNNQPHPNNQQFQANIPPMPPVLHGSKEMSQNNQGSCTPYSSSHHGQYMPNTNQQSIPINSHNVHTDNLQNSPQNNNSKMNHSGNQFVPSPALSKNQTSPTKHNEQKQQSAHNASQHSQTHASQQGTQTGVDHPGQNPGTQHRIQNMLGYSTGGQHPQQPHNTPFEQNVIMSKSMSGGQVLHGSQQPKHNMQNVLGKGDDSNRFRNSFDEQFPQGNEGFQGNYQKPGFYGQDFQFQYQGQYQFQDNQFAEQPGPSGQLFRKEEEKKDDDNKQKEIEKKNQRDGEEGVKTNTTSTSTETDDDREKRDKKDDEDKVEKKQETTPSKSVKEEPGIPYDWATELLKGYVPGDICASAKMAIFFCIIEEAIALGDRILVFSQSLFTLNLMEELLQQQLVPGKENEKWAKNVNYYRLDGSTSAMEREKLINEFNSNPNLHLFLVSTRAGSLGINLVGANRVIVFDASWNPCHDTQAVCRVYRYGQKKPCFVYRLVTDNCLEKKIYDRQINKQGMSDRVVDECNPDAHLSIKEVTSLCWDDKEDDTPKDFSNLQDSYIDVVLQKVIQKHSSLLSKEPFAHESLLVDRKEKKLSQAEKRLAKRSYELEKQASTRPVYNGVNQNQNRMKPMASVRPMQAEMGQGQRQRGWIPASVWQRQGMSAQEMTLPLDVVIPTNAADRASIVLKAGQKVMVLKSPKGIYMQLENGKIIAIRTAFKVGGKKPGEQNKAVGAGGAGTAEVNRRGIRQLGASRGRPVRAVGPVSRTPPVSVTVTRKRISEDDQPQRREEESQSPVNNGSAPPTPMEVTITPADKDAPNPFTAAAAASLSSMQVSPSHQHCDEMSNENLIQDKPSPQHPPQAQTPQSHPSPQMQQPKTPATPQPQVPTSPQPQAPVQPLPQVTVPSLPQVTIQPLKQAAATQQSSQPQPRVQPVNNPPSLTPIQPQVPVQPQVAVQPQPQAHIQPQPHIPLQPQSQITIQPQSHVPVQPQMHMSPAHSQSQIQQPTQQTIPVSQPPTVPVQVQHTQASPIKPQPSAMQPQPPPMQPQPPPMQPQHPPMQQPLPMQPQPSPMQPQPLPTQTQPPPMQPHPPPMQSQPPPLQPQTQIPLQSQYSLSGQPQSQQYNPPQPPHMQQSSPFVQTQPQKQAHFPPVMGQQPFSHPSQQSPQFPIPPQQQAQYMHPTQQPPHPFPMHPQSQYPVPSQLTQQPYQPQPQYPIQPHIQQSQYPHQFPLHPQPQFPLQPPPPQFEPPPPVAPSMITDQLS